MNEFDVIQKTNQFQSKATLINQLYSLGVHAIDNRKISSHIRLEISIFK